MSLQAGSKIIKVSTGETWTRGNTDSIGVEGIDHIDIRQSSEVNITYANAYDVDGNKLTDAQNETYDPIRFEANIDAIEVVSGLVFLVMI